MAVSSITYDVENIATTTLQNVRGVMADNIFKANPTVFFLLANGRVELESGGRYLEEPLVYARNNTVKSYTGYDTIDVSPTEEFTNARYSWKQFAGSISISGLEELQNSGPEAIFNMLSKKIEVAEMSMKETLDEYVHDDAASKDPKDFLGLDNLVEDVAGGSQGVVGGIDRVANTWWRNKFRGAVDPSTLTADMRTFYNECSRGITHPDILVTDYNLYELYEEQNQDKLRLHDTRLMDVGFDNLRFKGATLLPNEACLENHMYFLNTKFIRLKLHKRRNFVMTRFVKPHNQDARTSQILVAGNMTLNNSRFQGVLVTT